jgi:GNAT superfamily N-acetyltransferase
MEEIVISAVEDEAQFIRKKLNEYNTRFVPPDNHERLCLIAKRENKIIGGLVGGTYWNWLYIELFWVEESERNNGLGTRILAKAEEIATLRGCKNAHLETHDFQSLEFYKRRDYRVFAELEDLPEGHTKYFLRKRLIQR